MKRDISKKQILEEFDLYSSTLNIVFVDKYDIDKRGLWIGPCNIHRILGEIIKVRKYHINYFIFLTRDLGPILSGETDWNIRRYKEAADKFEIPSGFGKHGFKDKEK